MHLPDVDKVIALANYFHVTTDYLLGRTSSNLPVEVLQRTILEKSYAEIASDLNVKPESARMALTRARRAALALSKKSHT